MEENRGVAPVVQSTPILVNLTVTHLASLRIPLNDTIADCRKKFSQINNVPMSAIWFGDEKGNVHSDELQLRELAENEVRVQLMFNQGNIMGPNVYQCMQCKRKYATLKAREQHYKTFDCSKPGICPPKVANKRRKARRNWKKKHQNLINWGQYYQSQQENTPMQVDPSPPSNFWGFDNNVIMQSTVQQSIHDMAYVNFP